MKFEVPQPVPDYSEMSRIAIWVLIACLSTTVVIKSLEWLEAYIIFKRRLDHENEQFQKRLGIDFRTDKAKLESLALITRRNFSNECLTNRSLFRFRGTQNSNLEKELAKRDTQD